MKWLQAISGLFSSEKGLIGDLAGIADEFIQTKEEKAEFALKLKQFEAALLESQAQREKEIQEIYLADVADARSMQRAALAQDDKFSKRFLYYLSAGLLVLAFVYIFLITFTHIPEENVRFADTILGVVIGTIIVGIINFFFGSSKGSMDKQEIIKNLNPLQNGKVEK